MEAISTEKPTWFSVICSPYERLYFSHIGYGSTIEEGAILGVERIFVVLIIFFTADEQQYRAVKGTVCK